MARPKSEKALVSVRMSKELKWRLTEEAAKQQKSLGEYIESKLEMKK